MPDVVGETQRSAEGQLLAAGLRVSTYSVTTSEAKPGIVTSESPPAGQSIDPSLEVLLTVAEPPPTPEDVARSFAITVAAHFSRVSYAILTSRDGHMQGPSGTIPFGLALAISVKGKTPGSSLLKELKQAVADNLNVLDQMGFKYVVFGTAFKHPGDFGMVFGYSLSNWRKWGTLNQYRYSLGITRNSSSIQWKPV